MFLRTLEHEGFRNLQPGRLELGPGLNLLQGENGAGKSSLLEAVYFLFTTRSFRTASPAELVGRGGTGFRLAADLESGDAGHRVEVLQREVREVRVDGRKVGLEELVQRFTVLAFSSHQMDILRGGPRERRRFLDRGVLALRPAYLRELGEVQRTRAQRNALLRSGGSRREMAAWDERYVVAAARVVAARAAFTRRLNEAVGRGAGEMLPPGGRLEMEYRPSHGAGEAEPEQAVREALERSGPEERHRGRTLVGPHRDDLRVLGDGVDLGRFGSAGQQRTALLALKMTRLELIREARGLDPVLLVDDLDADLDATALRRLLERARRGQALLASCRPEGLGVPQGAARRFEVRAGAVRPVDGGGSAKERTAFFPREGVA